MDKSRASSPPPPRQRAAKRADQAGVTRVDSDDSDEDSASSSGDVRSRSQATKGVDGQSPTSSDEAGSAEEATMGG
jgi:hypothetical protein